MSRLISCRNCDSPDCDGCNIKILEESLKRGLLNKFMNEHHLIVKEKFVDAVPVVHGRWINRQPHMLQEYKECSVCGNVTEDYIIKHIDSGCMEMADPNYCPNCGAKMDGERRA